MMRKRFAGRCLLGMLVMMVVGCAHVPGGVAASTTPIEGRKYIVLGRASATDSLIYLLGILPVTDPNTTRDAISEAITSRGGDALINVTVEACTQWWILFTRVSTIVEGDAIRFTQ